VEVDQSPPLDALGFGPEINGAGGEGGRHWGAPESWCCHEKEFIPTGRFNSEVHVFDPVNSA
jgi:hypothetical protein